MLRGNVVFQRRYIDQALGQIGAKVDDLERANNGIEAGKLEAERGEINLLNLDGGIAGDGWEQRLKLLKLLALGVLLRCGLQDQAEVLTQATGNRVVEREVKDGVRRFA